MQNSKNTAILKYGLIAALTCLIISIFVYFQFFLNEPVFLKHYYELVIHENSRINLHLITNSNDDRRILKIKFPQMPKDFAYMELDYFKYTILSIIGLLLTTIVPNISNEYFILAMAVYIITIYLYFAVIVSNIRKTVTWDSGDVS